MRQRKFYGFVGCPGSGKSTYIAMLLKKYKGNVIIYKEHINIDDEVFADIPLVDIHKYRGGKAKISSLNIKYKDFLKWVYANFRNGIVLIDDATIYERNQITDELSTILAMRRHIGVDVWLVYHGFTGFPIDQFKFLNYVVLFHTTDAFAYKKNKVPCADDISAAKTLIKNRQHKVPDKYQPVILKLS